MYTIESLLYKNVNDFLRYYPISMVSKFMYELRGILRYIYLLQSSIESRSRTEPIRQNLVVYRGVRDCYKFVQLYESIIGDVVVWPAFTSTSTDRNSVLNQFVSDESSILFEIFLHPGDVAARIVADSAHESEREVLIPASTGFKILSVDYAYVPVQPEGPDPISLRIPVVSLSYFLHWHDFDLDQLPPPVLV
jgi:hypothetical protein